MGKVAVQSARWVVTKVAGTATWTAISSAVGGLVGSVGGPVGTVIGFLAGPAVTKLTEWTIKIACLGCGCATLMFAGTMISIIISIWAAFRPPEMGGAGPTALVEVVKTASPTHIDSGATGMAAEVSYTIEVKNKTNKEITDGTLVDTHDPADFLISVWANGDWVNGVGTWSGITIPPNGSFTVNPKGFIQNTNTDKVVVNNASFTGTLDGDSVSAGGSAVVIVGNPVGQPPSGWPVDEGCISQGFNVTSDPNASHYGKDMVDIAPKVAGSSGQPIYATHDGRAYAHYGDPTYGNYVIVVSANFQTRYAHLISIDPAVDVSGGADVVPGQPLGGMGNSGKSTATHLHYDVRDTKTGALVTSQYIPDSSFDGCVERGPCHCCFSGFDGACGSAP